LGGAHRDPQQVGLSVENYINQALRHLVRVPVDKLIERRYQKLRLIGSLTDGSIKVPGEADTKKPARKKRSTAKAKKVKS
jgi:acetyl-CoA carboxylase carboxyl transferase subunit alpha